MTDPHTINDKDFFLVQSNEEKIKFLLKYAILSPSTHNSQPWLFKIKRSSCEIYFNPKKKLPETDKTERDFFISLGCCLENIILSSKEFNVYKSHKISINANSCHVATIVFNFQQTIQAQKNFKKSKYLNAIQKRSNNRGFCLNKKINPFIINKLITIAKKYKDVDYLPLTSLHTRTKVVDLTAQGLRLAYVSKNFRREMSQWFIPNQSNKKEGIPGYAINFPDIISNIFPCVVKYCDIGPLIGFLNKKSMIRAPLISVLSTKKNSPELWVIVGQLAESIMLELQTHNISSSIYVASVEIGDLSKELKERLKIQNEPQFVFCSGYIKQSLRLTPRHSVNSKLIT